VVSPSVLKSAKCNSLPRASVPFILSHHMSQMCQADKRVLTKLDCYCSLNGGNCDDCNEKG